LDENEHVHMAGLSEYSNAAECKAFADAYLEGVPEAGLPTVKGWVAAKAAYEAARKSGDPLDVGTKEAFKAFAEAAKS
jgi:hypothetical protein